VFILSALDQKWATSKSGKAKFAKFFRKPVDQKILGETIISTCERQEALMMARMAQPTD
jgi:hypothetical protein